MKKLSILLSLVMVLGMAVSAAAADVTVSGEIKMVVDNADEASFLDTFAVKDAKVNFAAQVNDNLKATIQTNNGNLGNKWIEYKAGDITAKAGKYRLSRGGNVDSLAGNVEGFGVGYAFEGGNVNAAVALDPIVDSNTFAFNGKYAPVTGLTVYGDFIMPTLKDAKSAYAVEVDYEVAGFTVYGEYGKKADESDIQAVGATTTVCVFDLTVDYDLAGEELGFNAETNYDGIILGADFTKAKDADMVIGGYAKVKF